MKKTLTFKRERGDMEHGDEKPTPGSMDAIPPRHSLRQSLLFAMEGILQVAATQRNFRIQVVVGALVCLAGVYFHITLVEWIGVIAMSTLVLVLEMMNTAVESIVDMVTADYHPLAKIAKDIAAGAVLLAAFAASVVGLMIFLPYVMPLVMQWVRKG